MFGRLLLMLFLCATATQAAPLRVAVISDLNGRYGSTDYSRDVDRAVDRIIALNPDAVISTGDMVAGQRTNPHLSNAETNAMWSAFHTHVTDRLAAAGIPLLVTPGNHDASAYGGFEAERRNYDRTWTKHSPDVPILDGERYPFRYAVSLGGVLFISLDVTKVGKLPAEEMDWLDQILTSESPRHRATVLFSHLPLWPVAEKRKSDAIADNALQALLERHNVDVYLSGHHHAYYPGVFGDVLFVAQACLGGGARMLIGQKQRSPKALTLLTISDNGTINEEALLAPDFKRAVDLKTLPKSIGPLIRRDLAKPAR